MKKTSLIFASFFAVSFAMAQGNTAVTTQTGDGNQSTALQSGSNFAQTTQNGPGNIAETDQTGIKNEVIISQTNFATPGHFASVTQQGGNGNFADIKQEQRGASATVLQSGNDNTARLIQAGPNDAGTQTGNQAGITQIGDGNTLGNASFTGSAYMKNGTSFDNDKNFLEVFQKGNGNQAGAYIEHGSDVSIFQGGYDNKASVSSVSDPLGALNYASISQEGDRNSGSIVQERGGFTGNGNDASIIQFGDDNKASILQSGDANLGTITQTGSFNVGSISSMGISHVGTITQTGAMNQAVITQSGN